MLDDADLKGAVPTTFTICTHAGQGFAITTRLLVPRRLLDDATEVTAKVLAKLPAADPADPGTICGPLISDRQRERVEGYLRLAAAEGGRTVVGGGRPDGRARGFFVEPTLIAGLSNDARVAQEEIFGPVLVVIPHDGDDDAVALANAVRLWAVRVGMVRRSRPRGRRRQPHSDRHDRRQRRHLVQPRRPVRRLQAVRYRKGMGVPGFEEYLQTKSLAEPAQSNPGAGAGGLDRRGPPLPGGARVRATWRRCGRSTASRSTRPT